MRATTFGAAAAALINRGSVAMGQSVVQADPNASNPTNRGGAMAPCDNGREKSADNETGSAPDCASRGGGHSTSAIASQLSIASDLPGLYNKGGGSNENGSHPAN